MRLSRHVISPYETKADLAQEAAALDSLVEIAPFASDAEVVVLTSNLHADAGFLDRVPSCRLLITTTSGYDHIDLAELRLRGITGARLPLVRRDAVVEASLSWIIQGLRREQALACAAQAGRWARKELPQLGLQSLHGAEVGIVGLGVIGRRLAEVLVALGAHVLGVDPAGTPPEVEEVPLTELFARSAAVSLHCQLAPGSRQLIDASLLARARPGMVLVNTSRGDVLDLDAALDALRDGRLGSLGVDVFPTEPWSRMAELAAIPGCMVSPHSAGYHTGLARRVREGLVEAVSAFVGGRAPAWPLPLPAKVQDPAHR